MSEVDPNLVAWLDDETPLPPYDEGAAILLQDALQTAVQKRDTSKEMILRQKLFEQNRRLVGWLVERFCERDVDRHACASAGMKALLLAAKRYDPRIGPFRSFAAKYIKGYVLNAKQQLARAGQNQIQLLPKDEHDPWEDFEQWRFPRPDKEAIRREHQNNINWIVRTVLHAVLTQPQRICLMGILGHENTERHVGEQYEGISHTRVWQHVANARKALESSPWYHHLRTVLRGHGIPPSDQLPKPPFLPDLLMDNLALIAPLQREGIWDGFTLQQRNMKELLSIPGLGNARLQSMRNHLMARDVWHPALHPDGINYRPAHASPNTR